MQSLFCVHSIANVQGWLKTGGIGENFTYIAPRLTTFIAGQPCVERLP
jgi:hypothetical protein